VPRLVLSLANDWGATSLDLPAGTWHDELSGGSHRGGRVSVAKLLSEFPVALLVSAGRTDAERS
jgi:(1->4)-alpha-D-glucan 1-alpha-D-glucosylmutase